jgi:hypothetical protein
MIKRAILGGISAKAQTPKSSRSQHEWCSSTSHANSSFFHFSLAAFLPAVEYRRKGIKGQKKASKRSGLHEVCADELTGDLGSAGVADVSIQEGRCLDSDYFL